MEVRQQVVDAAEREARQDEELGAPGERPADGDRLEDAHGGRPHREDTRGGLDALPRSRFHQVALAVQRVLLDPIGLQRPEGVEPDVGTFTRSTSSCASTSGVKWSPAVGATAEPRSFAYTVW